MDKENTDNPFVRGATLNMTSCCCQRSNEAANESVPFLVLCHLCAVCALGNKTRVKQIEKTIEFLFPINIFILSTSQKSYMKYNVFIQLFKL